MNQRPVPLSFLGRSSSTTVNAQALVATKDRGGPYWGYGASHTNQRLRIRRPDRHGHVPPLTLLIYPVQSPCYKIPWDLIVPSPFIFLPPPPRHFDSLFLLPPALSCLAMPSFCANTTFSASRSSQRVGDAHNSRRHNPIGPSRTRLVNRHNPYATAGSQQDTDGSTLKGQRRNRGEGRPRPSTKHVSIHLHQPPQEFLTLSW